METNRTTVGAFAQKSSICISKTISLVTNTQLMNTQMDLDCNQLLVSVASADAFHHPERVF